MIGDVTGTRAVIAAAALILALAGCSDDPEPRVADPAPTSPSAPTTDASGPTPPEMPDAAKGTDAAAAEAFVRFYWETVNYAQETGDVDALSDLGSSECGACTAGVQALRDVFDANGDFRGGTGTVSINNVNFIQDDGQPNAVVEFEVTSTKQTVDYPGSGKDKVIPAGTVSLRAVLAPRGRTWLMSYWGNQ